MIPHVFVNRIETAVPDNECHAFFSELAPRMIADPRKRRWFNRVLAKSTIERRFTFLCPAREPDRIEANDFYRFGNFPTTAKRMEYFEEHAYRLAESALHKLELGARKRDITHLIVASCTGLYAPGLDIEIMKKFELRSDVERTFIGFMGCFSGINALKTAYHIVRSEPEARVLTVNLELCTLHFQETEDLEKLLSFIIFGDGCATTLVSAEPRGLRLLDFRSEVAPGTEDKMTWRIGDQGYDMHLSTGVPESIARGLPSLRDKLLPDALPMTHWAIHPGGKAVLDAVGKALQIPEDGLRHSRGVLRDFGNMSSAGLLFVLREMLRAEVPDGAGLAMAFGPGLTVESLRFAKGNVGS